MVVLFFIVIACMRVVQSVCSKRASIEVGNNGTFFLYGVYYQALAAVFSLLTLCIMGFDSFTVSTMICGLITAVFLMIQFFASLNAVKGCKIIISSMFNFGGLLICCLISWVWFGETMSVLQGIGLVLFFGAAYLLSSTKKENMETEKRRISKKTWILLIMVMLTEGCVEVSQKYFSLKVIGGSVAWYSFFMFAFSAIIMGMGLCVIQVKRNKTKTAKVGDSEVNLYEKKETKLRLNKALLVCGFLLSFAVFVINLLVTELSRTVSSAVLFPVSASISICITVLVGWIVYKEKLTVKNMIGVVLGLLAIMVLATFTPETVEKYLDNFYG